MGQALRYYLFMRREPPEVIGHNALASFTYMIIVCLYIVQTVTGFALYGQLHPVGIWHSLTDWMFLFVSNQAMRQIHHLVMFLLIGFAFHHVYSAWLVDMEEANGLMSSIFSGFKFIRHDQGPDWMERRRTVRQWFGKRSPFK
jgi:Ni/Fe-hydrogenase 1 B-type cytochrome subunit